LAELVGKAAASEIGSLITSTMTRTERRRPHSLSFGRICLGLGLVVIASAVWYSRPRQAIVGRVAFEHSGAPAPSAVVGIQGSTSRVRTGPTGRFALPRLSGDAARVVAWKPGHYIAGADWTGGRPVTLSLRTHPTEDSIEYAWVDPGPDSAAPENCANCHAETYRQWSASSHARSAVNRHFLDMFNGTDWHGTAGVGWNFSADHPDARPVCVACHVPSVAADDPAAEQPSRAKGVTREGIHCDFCHKIADTTIAESSGFLGVQHGRDALRLVRPNGDAQVFFGPLDDVDRGRDVYSPLYRSSLYCASCHEGTLFGTRAYETYSEWKASRYAARGVECQDCHMRSDGVTRNIAPGHGGIDRDPRTLSTHHFPGSMDETFLRSSVDMDLRVRRDGETLVAETTVWPVNVGHMLPTGSPDRHLILIVEATDAGGQPLEQLAGPVIPALGGVGPRGDANYAGRAGKLYAKVLAAADGVVPAPFWRAVTVQSDSRLRPDQPDTTEFRFGCPKPSTPARLRAALVYRRFYKQTIDEKSWPDQDVLLDQLEFVSPDE
jgi:hypothetical protein